MKGRLARARDDDEIRGRQISKKKSKESRSSEDFKERNSRGHVVA
jgi:hypothetical protein